MPSVEVHGKVPSDLKVAMSFEAIFNIFFNQIRCRRYKLEASFWFRVLRPTALFQTLLPR